MRISKMMMRDRQRTSEWNYLNEKECETAGFRWIRARSISRQKFVSDERRKILTARVFIDLFLPKLYDNSGDRSKNECATCIRISLEEVTIGGKNVVQEEDRFETLARIFTSGKDIVYIDCIRDNGYPYPPNRGLTNRVSKVTELINRWDVITGFELTRCFHSCIPVASSSLFSFSSS